LLVCALACFVALAAAVAIHGMPGPRHKSPRIGRFDLAPRGDEPDEFADRGKAERLCALVGLPVAARPARLIEVFAFQRETAMLAIKLRELQGMVDHFVVVEANHTFAGAPSRPWLQDGLLDGLGPWLGRSVHAMTVDARPECDDIAGPTAHFEIPYQVSSGDAAGERRWRCGWANELYRRRVGIDFAMERLGLDDRDVILVSDADEVLSREAAGVLKRCEWQPANDTKLVVRDMILPLQSMHYFGLDHHQPAMWRFSRAVRARLVRRHGSAAVSSCRCPGFESTIGEAGKELAAFVAGGWHMSFFVSARAAARKMTESNHAELVYRHTADRERIEACMASGWDAWGRDDHAFHGFTSLGDAARRQELVSAEVYETLYGRVPRLMEEYPGFFGERRPWAPGGLRRGATTEAEHAALEAKCRSVGHSRPEL